MQFFPTRNPEAAYPSEHRRTVDVRYEAHAARVAEEAEECAKRGEIIAAQHSRTKAEAAAHYTEMAEEARLESYAELDTEAILADAALEGFEMWIERQ